MLRHIGTMITRAVQPIAKYKASDKRGCLPSAITLPTIPAMTQVQRKINTLQPIHPPTAVRQIGEYEPAIMT